MNPASRLEIIKQMIRMNHAAQLAIIKQMKMHESCGQAGDYQADEQA